jgi:hypothetical protein
VSPNHTILYTPLSAAFVLAQVVNGFGVAKGKHKICGTNLSVINLGKDVYSDPDEILLQSVVLNRTYKKFGMSRVLSGRTPDGRLCENELNLRTDMDELDEGVWCEIPADDGSMRLVRLKSYLITTASDMLGKKGYLPYNECCGAHVHCDGCNQDTRHPFAFAPFSFLNSPCPDGPAWKLRDWSNDKAALQSLRRGEVADPKKLCTDVGFNKLYFGLDPDDGKFPNPTKHPADGMHTFSSSGVMSYEGAYFINTANKLEPRGFLGRANAAISAYPNWPSDVSIPQLHESLTAPGKLKASKSLRMTASQTSTFFLHARQLLQPILSPRMIAHPAWASFCKLAEIWTVVVQHSIRVGDIQKLDALIVEHSALFDQVDEYAGMKRPKHHSMAHVPIDIWRYGPTRGYWCFGFEAFNKLLKRGAKRGNFKRTCVSVAQYWSLRSARRIVKKRRGRYNCS